MHKRTLCIVLLVTLSLVVAPVSAFTLMDSGEVTTLKSDNLRGNTQANISSSEVIIKNTQPEIPEGNTTEVYNESLCTQNFNCHPDFSGSSQIYGTDVKNNQIFYMASFDENGSRQIGISKYPIEGELPPIGNRGDYYWHETQLEIMTKLTETSGGQSGFGVMNSTGEGFSIDNTAFAFQENEEGTHLVSSDSGDEKLYITNYQEGTETYSEVLVHDAEGTQNNQIINGMDTITVKGQKAIVYGTGGTGNPHGRIYQQESGSTTDFHDSASAGTEFSTENFEAAGIADDTFILTNRDSPNSGQGFGEFGNHNTYVYNLDTGMRVIEMDLYLGKGNGKIAVTSESTDTANPESFPGNNVSIFNETDVSENGLDLSNAETTITPPSDVTRFDRVFYKAGYWFMADWNTNQIYVYNEDYEPIEVIEHTGATNDLQPIIQDNTIMFGATENGNQFKVYSTGIELSTGCMDFLQPSDLSELPNAPGVCWIPMFTGIGFLNTVYQWLVLAVLISVPIAKETNSDIATMATINGVLLIGMVIGTLSPAIVATGVLGMFLLTMYAMSGTDVQVNMDSGGEI